jgi:RecB family exonuclease
LPFEDSEGWLDLSVTQLGAYDYCPFDFYLENVLAIRQPAGPQMAFGSVIHRVFERYFKAKMSGSKVEIGELHVLLDELWSNRGYERQELADADRQLAHDTIDRVLRREQLEPHTVLGSEMSVRFELPEVKLRIRGKIDALFKVEEGVEIRDFKTGRTKTDAEKLAKTAKENFQLRTYALSYQLMSGSLPAQVVLDYVVTGVEGFAKLTPLILKKHREKLGALAQKIRSGEFAANASVVHTCAAIKFYGTGEYDELAQEILAGLGGGAV